ncbi:hypothetical protein Lumi_054 [Xylophilus phage Lumi]|nr:hypothetical protein Lumi_054 [Xylophilus phage Lumi]
MTNQQIKSLQTGKDALLAIVMAMYERTIDEDQMHAFLHDWVEGDWAEARKLWPDAPAEVWGPEREQLDVAREIVSKAITGDVPEHLVVVDAEKAKALGIPIGVYMKADAFLDGNPQTRPADGERLYQEVEKILDGIDRTETDPGDTEGWWETSSGASFGQAKLVALKSLLTNTLDVESLTSMGDPDGAGNLISGQFVVKMEVDGKVSGFTIEPTDVEPPAFYELPFASRVEWRGWAISRDVPMFRELLITSPIYGPGGMPVRSDDKPLANRLLHALALELLRTLK